MAGINPAVNPVPQPTPAPVAAQPAPAAAAPVVPVINPADPQAVLAQPAAVTQQLVEVPVDANGLPLALPLGPGSSPVGIAGFSQAELMVVVTQLLDNLKSIGGRRNNMAATYLRNSGVFSVSPLEQGVKVHQADNNSYFQALGYEA